MLVLILALSCRSKDQGYETGLILIDQDGDGFDVENDCDDNNPSVNPDAIEVCNGIDDDCSGEVDDAVGGLWYADADGDGFGDPDVVSQSCDGEEGTVADSSDCDDGDAQVNLAADEVCDGRDNDCDGDIDLDAVDAGTWYVDGDLDGFGDPETETRACEGEVSVGEDCDDEDLSINPDAEEICDGRDNDCDGRVDPSDSVDAQTWYADTDGDGYGTSSTTLACEQPSGWAAEQGDCDDDDASSWPDASESCDEADNDCDGSVDEGVESTWYLDSDGDGYGDDDVTAQSCDAPTSSYIATGGDCDDSDKAYNPGAEEGCDGNDYDCDGDVDSDADGDDYADESCGGDDCDDADAGKYPDSNGLCALGTTCNDILSNYSTSVDGDYAIDPDGLGTGLDPFEVVCDMSTDGGGWTLIEYASDLAFKQHFTSGDGWKYLPDDFEFELSDDQISAVQGLSTEGFQTYQGLCEHVIHYYYDSGASYVYAFGFMFFDGDETPYGGSSYSPYNISVTSDGCSGNGSEAGDPSKATYFYIESEKVPILTVQCRDCGDAFPEMFGSTLTDYPAYLR